jgi:protein-disulfide isomerase
MNSNAKGSIASPMPERDHYQGPLNATITLMEYGNYQCLQSGQVHTTLKAMQAQLGEQLCYVFRHFPKAPFSQSFRAAESAEAAAVQGKFWEMHDLLFEHQQSLEDGDLVQYAAELGLDMPQFLREMAEHVYVARVQEDIDSGYANGVEDTPTFLINIRHEGTQNLEPLLQSLLKTYASNHDAASNKSD